MSLGDGLIGRRGFLYKFVTLCEMCSAWSLFIKFTFSDIKMGCGIHWQSIGHDQLQETSFMALS
jgi:hypothetical protein